MTRPSPAVATSEPPPPPGAGTVRVMAVDGRTYSYVDVAEYAFKHLDDYDHHQLRMRLVKALGYSAREHHPRVVWRVIGHDPYGAAT